MGGMRCGLALLMFCAVGAWQNGAHAHGFFVVNTTSDHDDGACDEAPAGDCSLREAIAAANALPNDHPDAPDSIGFDFGAGAEAPFEIRLGAPLPEIVEGAVLDGASEPRYILGGDGVPVILVDGAGVDHVFRVRSDNTLIVSLALTGAAVSGIDAERSDYLLVRGCYFGVDPRTGESTGAPGEASFGAHAIHVRDTFRVRLGGPDALHRNVAAGSGAQAILLERTDGAVLRGNLVGVDPSGLNARPNALWAAGAFAVDVRSAQDMEVLRNVVSSNAGGGIALSDVPGAIIEDNRIGVDAEGRNGLGNGDVGLQLAGDMDGVLVRANVISSNGGDGVSCKASSTGQWAFLGNTVGVDTSRSQVLPNLGSGVTVEAGCDEAAIGAIGTGQGNLIAHNLGAGIRLVDGMGVARGNSVFSNGGLGIDAGGEGVTGNDPSDAALPLNFPIVREILEVAEGLTVEGCAPTGATIDVYEASEDPSGFGEGMRHLGAVVEGSPLDEDTTAGCSLENEAAFSFLLETDATIVTLTATHRGRTSEFSPVYSERPVEPEPLCQSNADCASPTPACNQVLQVCEACVDDAGDGGIDSGCASDAPQCEASMPIPRCVSRVPSEPPRRAPDAGGCSVGRRAPIGSAHAFMLLILLGLLQRRCALILT